MRLRLFVAAAAVTVLSASLAAHADIVYTTGDLTVTLPNSPTPTSFTSDDFFLDDVQYAVAGTTYTGVVEISDVGGCYSFVIGDASSQGNCSTGSSDAYQPFYFLIETQPLFSGSTADPTLLAGTFTGTVKISSVGFADLVATDASVTPEPSSFALLGTGLLGVVGALRRRPA